MTRNMLLGPLWLALSAIAAPSLAFVQISFSDGVELPGLALQPTNPAFGDIDGDGLQDLVFSTDSGSELRVMRGGLDGRLQPAVPFFDAQSSTSGLALADLDGDGDVEVVHTDGFFVRVWTRIQSGAFAVSFTAQAGGRGAPSCEDVDGDGVLDIVVAPTKATGPDFVYVLRGTGGLTFGPGIQLVSGLGAVHASELGDIDGDGDLDLAVIRNELLAVENDGTFPWNISNVVDVSAQTSPFVPDFFSLFDADGDGDLDIATGTNGTTQGVMVAGNVGGFLFTPSVQVTTGAPNSVRAGDVNGDGNADLVFGNANDAEPMLGAVLGDGMLSFSGEVAAGFFFFSTTGVLLADIDADGASEVFATRRNSFGTSTAAIDRFDWSGTGFDAPDYLNEGVDQIDAADLDGDGVVDIVAFANGPSRIVWKRGLGSGAFGTATTLAIRGLDGTEETGRFGIGDIDGNGAVDLVFTRSTQGGTAFPLSARLGTPGVGLGPTVDLMATNPIGGIALSVALVDLNTDSLPDLILSDQGFGNVAAALNGGAGTFQSTGLLGGTAQSNIDPEIIVDVDDDGVLDVVMRFTSTMQWFRGLGDGTFAPRATLLALSFANELTAYGDYTGDGRLDIVTIDRSQQPERLSVYEGLGLGQFGDAATALFDVPYDSPRLVDLDLDGTLDLVAVRDQSQVVVRKGLAPAVYGSEVVIDHPILDRFAVEPVPAEVDLDGDGDLDLVHMEVVPGPLTVRAFIAWNRTFDDLGTSYCGPAVVNSTGDSGQLGAYGSAEVDLNQFELRATSLPPSAFGFFLTSRVQGLVTAVPNSVGTLCLGGAIGRFVGAGQIGAADAGGALTLGVDLTALPTPNLGLVPALPGETWNFQAWHRDSVGGQATSNFTDGLAVTFL